MQFQRMLSNGTWHNESRVEMFVDLALEREPFNARLSNRQPMVTREQVLAFLATGQTLKYDSEYWYAQIRDADALKPRQVRPADYPTGSRLDCGHIVYDQSQVMSASLGTSCPDCYDRMSD